MSYPFTDNLCKSPTTGINELRQRKPIYMQLEVLKEFKGKVRDKNMPEKN